MTPDERPDDLDADTGDRTDDAEDAIVFAQLREALRPVPGAGSVAELARAAYTFRTMEAELAALVTGDDDAGQLGESAGALARFRGEPRVLVFRAADGWMEIEHVDGDLVGQVVPACVCDLVVESADGNSSGCTIDELGCFIVSLPSTGPVRLRLTGQNIATVVTDWVVFR